MAEDGPIIIGSQVQGHIDAYFEYDQLVGESDGGVALSEKVYEALKRKAKASSADRLFCTWRSKATGLDCVNVGPSTRCFCGHMYKSHA